MRKLIKKTDGGFALIEVLVAGVIIAVGVVYVFRSFSAAIGAVKRSRAYNEAGVILEKTLHDVDNGDLHVDTFRDSMIVGENARYVLHAERLPSPHLTGLGVGEVYFKVTWDEGRR